MAKAKAPSTSQKRPRSPSKESGPRKSLRGRGDDVQPENKHGEVELDTSAVLTRGSTRRDSRKLFRLSDRLEREIVDQDSSQDNSVAESMSVGKSARTRKSLRSSPRFRKGLGDADPSNKASSGDQQDQSKNATRGEEPHQQDGEPEDDTILVRSTTTSPTANPTQPSQNLKSLSPLALENLFLDQITQFSQTHHLFPSNSPSNPPSNPQPPQQPNPPNPTLKTLKVSLKTLDKIWAEEKTRAKSIFTEVFSLYKKHGNNEDMMDFQALRMLQEKEHALTTNQAKEMMRNKVVMGVQKEVISFLMGKLGELEREVGEVLRECGEVVGVLGGDGGDNSDGDRGDGGGGTDDSGDRENAESSGS